MALAEAGAKVVIADRDAASAEQVASDLGGDPWVVDLSDLGGLDDVRLDCDILVNNAGFQHVAPIEDFPPALFDTMLAVMLQAPFRLIRAALPHMYANGFGRIVNISSIHGIRASPFKSAYVSAKHGLEGMSKTVALEGGAKGVSSTCISPGYVRTPLVTKQIADQARAHRIPEDQVLERILLADSAIKRLVEPHEVAELALWLCGPSGVMANGTTFTLDGGWSAH